jgi:hypothetical protein
MTSSEVTRSGCSAILKVDYFEGDREKDFKFSTN